jgi:hypothetical protein
VTPGDSLESVLGDAQWLPHDFDRDGATLSFVRVTREMHRALPFVDERQLRDAQHWVTASSRRVLEGPLGSVPLHFVFHTGLCCSTLLVNALDATGEVAGFKEPQIFLSLLRSFETGEDLTRTRRVELALRLLARPFGARANILKPSCFANPLIPDLLRAAPAARAVLLQSDLRSFLRSVAKQGIRGRSWARQVYASCIRHFALDLGYSSQETWQQTDLQIAGLAWLMRHNHFSRLAANFGPRRTLRVAGSDLVADPVATLVRVSRFFGLPVDERVIKVVASGSVFTRHSKSGKLFKPTPLSSKIEQDEEELEIVAGWIETIAGQRGISLVDGEPDLRLAG